MSGFFNRSAPWRVAFARRFVPGALQALSVPQGDLMDELEGKSVAIVGNARALAATRQGAAIDAADIVIRINRAPRPDPASHGWRTDWLALATRISAAEFAEIAPARLLWLSHKRKRLPLWAPTTPGFYLHGLTAWQALAQRLEAPPTTGLMMIDLVAGSKARSITLHGFDFFTSLSLTGSRAAHQVPHDFAAEHAFVTALIDRDPRVRLVAM